MDDAPFLIRHWELLALIVFSLGIAEMVIAWKLGLHKQFRMSGLDVLGGVAAIGGAVILFGGGALIIWLMAGVITSMPGW